MLHYWALLQGLGSLPPLLSLSGFVWSVLCIHKHTWTMRLAINSCNTGCQQQTWSQEKHASINTAKVIIPRRVPFPLKISSVCSRISQCKHIALNFTSFTVEHCCTAMEGNVWILCELSTVIDTKSDMWSFIVAFLKEWNERQKVWSLKQQHTKGYKRNVKQAPLGDMEKKAEAPPVIRAVGKFQWRGQERKRAGSRKRGQRSWCHPGLEFRKAFQKNCFG